MVRCPNKSSRQWMKIVDIFELLNFFKLFLFHWHIRWTLKGLSTSMGCFSLITFVLFASHAMMLTLSLSINYMVPRRSAWVHYQQCLWYALNCFLYPVCDTLRSITYTKLLHGNAQTASCVIYIYPADRRFAFWQTYECWLRERLRHSAAASHQILVATSSAKTIRTSARQRSSSRRKWVLHVQRAD
jgi:hypothetical protein